MNVAAPYDEAELLARAAELAGLRLHELALRFGAPVPPDLRRAKGFVGGLLERALGATAARERCPLSRAGIELKNCGRSRGGQ